MFLEVLIKFHVLLHFILDGAMNISRYILVLILLSLASAVYPQNKPSFIASLYEKNHWVDSVFRKLNRHDRIAQLFMIRAHTDRGKAYEDSVAEVIREQHIGGLVFFQGGPERQAALTNRYQAISFVPLLIAMDAEW